MLVYQRVVYHVLAIKDVVISISDSYASLPEDRTWVYKAVKTGLRSSKDLESKA